MVSSCFVWDFTASDDSNTLEGIKDVLRTFTKRWAFQKETGTSGFVHYQGRISLKVKKSTEVLVQRELGVNWHISRTTTENMDNDFYVTKQETRTEGPWTDKDVAYYMPRQLREAFEKMRPWQRYIYDRKEDFDARTVNVIYDSIGNTGKSTIASLADCMGWGLDIDAGNDGQAIIQDVCDQCIGMDTHAPGVLFVDLERSFRQTELWGMFTAIERIKKGKLSDRRYKYTKW